MKKQCIEKTIYDIDYHRLFPDILSPANIWNDPDDESDEEESMSHDCNPYVLLKILFPCLRVLRLEDSNLSGMDKVY